MIRNLLLATVASFALGGAALAADMPSYPAEAAAIVEAPAAQTWAGMYVGIHGGWNWAETGAEGVFPESDMEGFVIGGQVGYNWQMNNIVFGIEADGSYVDNDDDGDFGTAPGGIFAVGVEQNYLASVRGRLGFGFDKFLVYGTGGAAFTGLDFNLGTDEDDANYFGWVAGGGVEFAVTQNVTVGVEYLHYEFGDESIGSSVLPDDVDIDLSNDVVRGRLNVKFDSIFGR
jgi:outer membrane immunogenic protein